ncbi:MAG: flagellar motor switch protein FliN [Sphingomonas sp.]
MNAETTNLGDAEAGGLGLLAQVPVRLSVEVGAASLRLRDVLALEEGGVIELDRQADEPLDIKVNGTLIARGEIVVIEGRFGVRLVEICGDDAVGFPQVERRG